MNLVGLVAGIALFSGVWVGHVLVRKIEFHSTTLWMPGIGFALLGLVLGSVSLLVEERLISVGLGILGMTFLWDGLEFYRQQKRVIKGHAPANPANPRHRRILDRYPAATVYDLLDREPVCRPVSLEEAIQLVEKKSPSQ